jgi:hypothetical protein
MIAELARDIFIKDSCSHTDGNIIPRFTKKEKVEHAFNSARIFVNEYENKYGVLDSKK